MIGKTLKELELVTEVTLESTFRSAYKESGTAKIELVLSMDFRMAPHLGKEMLFNYQHQI